MIHEIKERMADVANLCRRYDVEEASREVQKLLVGLSFEEYRGDAMLKSAVEPQFGIIGDALSRAFAIDPGRESRITSLRRIIDFRNRLIHGYADVQTLLEEP